VATGGSNGSSRADLVLVLVLVLVFSGPCREDEDEDEDGYEDGDGCRGLKSAACRVLSRDAAP
jgi:hypothetical protein